MHEYALNAMLALGSEAPRATRARMCAALVWGAFVCADLPREVVGRALGGRDAAKTLLLSPADRRDVVATQLPLSSKGTWLRAGAGAECDTAVIANRSLSGTRPGTGGGGSRGDIVNTVYCLKTTRVCHAWARHGARTTSVIAWACFV